jgi:hypothetical protein
MLLVRARVYPMSLAKTTVLMNLLSSCSKGLACSMMMQWISMERTRRTLLGNRKESGSREKSWRRWRMSREK